MPFPCALHSLIGFAFAQFAIALAAVALPVEPLSAVPLGCTCCRGCVGAFGLTLRLWFGLTAGGKERVLASKSIDRIISGALAPHYSLFFSLSCGLQSTLCPASVRVGSCPHRRSVELPAFGLFRLHSL
jgi:hypothetical protein